MPKDALKAILKFAPKSVTTAASMVVPKSVFTDYYKAILISGTKAAPKATLKTAPKAATKASP